MEESIVNEPEVRSVEQPREEMSPVSFPQPAQRKKGGIGKFLIIFLGLAILGVIGFLVFKGVSGGEATPTETPSVESISGSSDSSSSEATPTPEPVDKASVSIKIENGTGIAGEASYLQGILENLGYSKIEAGNADSQDNTATQITFSADLSQAVIDEITNKLSSVYESVKTNTSSSQTSSDVIIVTGLRKGATAKPAATDAPTSTTSPSPSASPAN